MQNEARAQSQSVNIAAYPQFCGSWPNDEWPEDELIDQHRSFAEVCAGLYLEHESEIGWMDEEKSWASTFVSE